jgi:hypothetical protein
MRERNDVFVKSERLTCDDSRERDHGYLFVLVAPGLEHI